MVYFLFTSNFIFKSYSAFWLLCQLTVSNTTSSFPLKICIEWIFLYCYNFQPLGLVSQHKKPVFHATVYSLECECFLYNYRYRVYIWEKNDWHHCYEFKILLGRRREPLADNDRSSIGIDSQNITIILTHK